MPPAHAEQPVASNGNTAYGVKSIVSNLFHVTPCQLIGAKQLIVLGSY